MDTTAYDLHDNPITVPGAETPRFNRTNDSIGWARWSWNPVTGCKHACDYCYASELANSARMKPYYPIGFEPLLHPHRLDAPAQPLPRDTSDPAATRVFVCSMADLFGRWVPDEWIEYVMATEDLHPKWTYIHLTKWPERYKEVASLLHAGGWYGATITNQRDYDRRMPALLALKAHRPDVHIWASMEPLSGPITVDPRVEALRFVAVGGRSRTKGLPAMKPPVAWYLGAVDLMERLGVEVYRKSNLA